MRYAIVETGGTQFKMEKESVIIVPRLPGEIDGEIVFNNVLYSSDEGAVNVGDPYIEGAKVSARIIRHGRGQKIKVFKFKRRKGYKKLQGHRQDFTEIKVTGIEL